MMFNKFFDKYPEYEVVKKADIAVLEEYRSTLPVELTEFWKTYGFGTYMDSYLKIINPNEFQDSLNEAFDNPNNKEIVFAISAFGDYFLWTGNAIRLVKFRYGTYSIIENGDDMSWFFDMDLADDQYVKHNLAKSHFELAKERLGELAYDECYGYVPILAAGGPEKVENIQKLKLREHILIISQLAGKIE